MSILNEKNVRDTIDVIEQHITFLTENDSLTNKKLNTMLRALKAGGKLEEFKVVHTKAKDVIIKDIYLRFPSKIDFIQINVEVSSY